MVFPLIALMQDRIAERRDSARFEQDRRARERKEWEREDALRVSMTDAAKPVTPQDGTTYQPAMDDEGYPMPANPTAGMLAVGDKKYRDPAEANAAAAQASTMPASMRRQAAVMQRAGRLTEAQQLQSAAKKFEEEGVLQFIDANVRRLPSVDDIKAGKGADFDLDGLTDYNGAGKDRLPDGARGRAKVLKLPNGMEITDFEVVGKDGKVIAPSARQVEAIYGYSRAERDRTGREMYGQVKAIEHQGTMASIAQQNADSVERSRRDTANYHGGMLSLARDRADAEAKPQTAENTFDIKTASDIAKDMVKKEAEEAALNQTPMTPAQVAQRVDGIVNAMRQTHTNRFIQSTVQRTLGVAQADPAAYAAEYGKALQLVPQSVLTQMGFQPPARAAAAPQPAPGARPQPAPSMRPASMQTAATAPAEPQSPFDAAGAQLDAAKAQVVQARDALMKYGSRQRAKDPGGFETARAALAQAEAAAAQAEAAFAAATPQMSAAFGYPNR